MKKLTDIANDILKESALAKSTLTESSLSRIWKHVTEHESGTITAFRFAPECGNGKPYTKAENRERNSELKSKLLSLGYGVTGIGGYTIENYGAPNAKKVKEESFIVVDLNDKNNLKNDLIRLGTYFEQDSITFSKPSGEYYLIGTNKCRTGYPGNGHIGKSVKLGKSFFGKPGEFYSTINGRPFVFENVNPNLSILSEYPATEARSFIMRASGMQLD